MNTNLSHVTTLLFDFDGVLADTESGRFMAYGEILKEYGFSLQERCELRNISGLTGDGILTKYFPELSREQMKDIITRRQRLYMSNLQKYCPPYPGAVATLRDLKRLGYFMALTTANSTTAAHTLLEALGAHDCFDAVCGKEICEDPVRKVKDYSLVPKHLNRTIEECAVIEDSPVGVRGARRSGFFCIAFERFPHPDITANADILLHDYNEFRALFGLPAMDLQA